jgi:hypothetical protein
VAQRVDGMRGRLGFSRLDSMDRERFAAALERLSPEADARLLEIIASPSA